MAVRATREEPVRTRAAVLLRRLGQLYLVASDGSVRSVGAVDPGPGPASEPDRVLAGSVAEGEVRVDSADLLSHLRLVRPSVGRLASVEELRAARARLPRPSLAAERRYLLSTARRQLEQVLASPEEVLISLAREDERLERVVGREARAAEAFLAPEGSPLQDYAQAWASVRSELEHHRASLADRTRREAQRVAPNLAAIVGPGVAARLVAAAGGVAPLARMRASRLQLLGSRRRPSPDHGPRYGLIYRAERMSDLPPDRRGAYARSLAALATIAVRADSLTHRDLSRTLCARRDRRIEQLRRRSR